MHRHTRHRPFAVYILLVCTLLTACATTSGEAPASRADRLAQKAAEATGDPTGVDQLAFSFLVERDGEEVVRRRHVWRPQDGELQVSGGGQTIALEHVDEHDLSALSDAPKEHAEIWREVAPNASPEDAAQAWAWFVNDSYWLLAPAKLFDPGVRRALDDQGRLVLTFGEVGLTPDDRYVLEVDGERGLVTGWAFTLENGREGAFDWTDYERFGPLMLSTRKVAREGDVVIRFEDIEAAP